jgi:glutamine synthetase
MDLQDFAEKEGIKYFMISFTDLFGAQRAKLVPAQAIGAMQKDGAGFAGFASWLDMSPADPDMLAVPDANSVIKLPWKKDVAWVPGNCVMNGNLVKQAPRNVLNAAIRRANKSELRVKTGIEAEFFSAYTGWF